MTRFNLIIVCLTLAFSMIVVTLQKVEAQEIGSIEHRVLKAEFVIDLSGGLGALHYEGAAYPLYIGGVSLGPRIVGSSYEFTGTVYNLTRPEDIYGKYTAGTADTALVGGGKVATLTNVRGVRMEVDARTIGAETSLDLGRISIQPR